MIQNQPPMYQNLRQSSGSPTNLRPPAQNYQSYNYQLPQSSTKASVPMTLTTQQQYQTPQQFTTTTTTQQYYQNISMPPQQQPTYYQQAQHQVQPSITNYVPLSLTQQFKNQQPILYQNADNSSSSSSNQPTHSNNLSQVPITNNYQNPQQPPKLQESLPSDTQILQQELNKARQRIAELEKQMIIAGPEADLWKTKFYQKDQEIQTLRQSSQFPKSESGKQEDRDREFRELVAVNQQLMLKLKEQQQSQSRVQVSGIDNQDMINELRMQLDSKDRELEQSKRMKIQLEKEISALQAEKKAMELQLKQSSKARTQNQQSGCM